jgi:acyl-CoA reductase-like NAD-dependent aldehyde dehydrogenase
VDVMLKTGERSGYDLRPPLGSGPDLVVASPWDGHEVGRVPTTTAADVEGVVQRAQAAFEQWRWTRSWKRYQILDRMSKLLEEHREPMAGLIAAEAAKPYKDAYVEAGRAASTYRWAAEEAKRTMGEMVDLGAEESGQDRFGWTLREPLGVILAISPFNFPLNLVAHKVAPALAAANAVILKPASATPLTALYMAHLLDEAGLPPDVLQVVIGSGSEIGTPLVKDERIRMLTFTGSPEVGKQLASAAGLKRVTLELGSNSATIVDEDADLDLAAERVVAGGFAFSGQVCISVQRVIVHDAVYDRFVPDLVGRVAALKVGDPLDPSTDVSALISKGDHQRVREWVQEAVEMGATLETGGFSESDGYRPIVLTNVSREMKVCRKEVFGPVLSVTHARDLCHAIEIANDSDFGLQAGVFTKDLNKALYAARHLHVGGVMINEVPTFRVDHMPYGGVKDSGIGREGVKYAIQEMTELKMVGIREVDWCPVYFQPQDGDGPMRPGGKADGDAGLDRGNDRK